MAVYQYEGKEVVFAESVGKNTRLGEHALEKITTGEYNTAIGWNCLRLLTTGSSNTGAGQEALEAVTVGKENVAIGKATLTTLDKKGATEGNRNVAIGDNAGKELLAGINNTIVGHATGEGLPGESSSNTISGAFALSNAEGEKSENLAWGESAGANLVTGNKNVFIGNKVGEAGSYSERLYIGIGSGSTPLIKGNFASGSESLTINGTLTSVKTFTAEAAATVGKTLKVKETLTAEGGLTAEGTLTLPSESIVEASYKKESIPKTKLVKTVQEELLKIETPTAFAAYTSAKEETETKGTFITLIIKSKAEAAKAVVKLVNSGVEGVFEWDALAAGAQKLALPFMVKKAGKWTATLSGAAESATISRVTMEP